MYSNEQCTQLVNLYVKNMEKYINIIETELKSENPNLMSISNASGKLSQIYSFVVELTGAFSGNDSRVGGFRESTWISGAPKEEKK